MSGRGASDLRRVALTFLDYFAFNRRRAYPLAPRAAVPVEPAPRPEALMSRPEHNDCNTADCADGSTAAPARPERRRAPRQTLVARIVLTGDASPTPVTTGFISNISALGIGFHTRRPLAVGGNYQMRIELGPMRWATRLRVVTCKPHGTGSYDVGAEFVAGEVVTSVLAMAA